MCRRILPVASHKAPRSAGTRSRRPISFWSATGRVRAAGEDVALESTAGGTLGTLGGYGKGINERAKHDLITDNNSQSTLDGSKRLVGAIGGSPRLRREALVSPLLRPGILKPAAMEATQAIRRSEVDLSIIVKSLSVSENIDKRVEGANGVSPG